MAEKQVGKLPSVRRLPLYLRLLREQQASGRAVVSSAHLAVALDILQIQVKKDLEITGITGKPGVGFQVDELIAAIENYLGWNNVTDAVVVGAGHLGQALMGYAGFKNYGLNIVAAFDSDATLAGQILKGVPVLPIDKLEDLLERLHIHLAVLTVPAEAAQSVCERLVAAGVKGIWNFTPVRLAAPEGVIVRSEDLAAGLAELSLGIKQQLGV
ncbi:MAG: Redox-sensing transcriptional repressor Rex [Deltaproteobacteria bacterium ADurb.Bin510]|nr:MAG: Redox-sensing transcriptional repressor Rex [Deltaproteobacteria bacterium ADurb.Bin510]